MLQTFAKVITYTAVKRGHSRKCLNGSQKLAFECHTNLIANLRILEFLPNTEENFIYNCLAYCAVILHARYTQWGREQENMVYQL